MSADDICVTEEGMLDLELNSINNNALKSFIEKNNCSNENIDDFDPESMIFDDWSLKVTWKKSI